MQLQRTADSLVVAVMLDNWPSPAAVVDFGITDQLHYEALYYPIRNGEITADKLFAVVGNGEGITKLVDSCHATKIRIRADGQNKVVFKTVFDI